MNTNNHETVCIIGMGYVGLTLGVGLASAGCRVIGVENNPSTLESLNSGRPHIYESNLSELYAKYFKCGSISIREKIDNSSLASVYIVTVGTPLDESGNVNLEAIKKVTAMISESLKDGDLVILRSTVKVGTTRLIVKPILDKAGVSYFLAMCPERTVEGHALEELCNLPQIVGGINDESSERAKVFFSCIAKEVKNVSSTETAEMVKLVCNTQRDLSFAYANEIALLSEKLNLDACEIISAANYNYPRSNVPSPGMVGGPCLEKDTYILAESLERDTVRPELIMTARKLNESLTDYAVKRVGETAKALGKNIKKVAIMGLAFKGEPETGDIRGSLAIRLQHAVMSEFPDVDVIGYDPIATIKEATYWGLKATDNLEKALIGADVVFVQNNHKFFRESIFGENLMRFCHGSLVYDFWNCLDKSTIDNINIMGLGQPLLNMQKINNNVNIR